MSWPVLARLRVPLGFLGAAVAFVLAHPTSQSIAIGGAVAIAGEVLRIWASGHIEKGREVTRSGPYRLVRHPLYLGSAIMAAGFAVASRSPWVGALAAIYVGATFLAAMRSEEAALDQRFAGEYTAYREGRAAPVRRSFSFSRVIANREYRAMAGLAVAIGILLWKR
ncbi:MAG TPA: isoprenylcysteine carboxylmethyltransferase family protein [Vicinamibacterales bacterium]|nr:isoprenylcysteine carboxylmethyltransferase family protein [Vicinamibacterales bacterium]